MRVRGRWVIGPIMAILVTACGATGSALTPPPVAPAAPSATVGGTTPPTVTPTPRPTATHPPATRPPATALPATPPPAPGGQAVHISDFAFAPRTITVAVGTRVTWMNLQPAIQHTVTADDGSFGSNPLSTGTSFSRVFTIVGTYPYHCSIHTDMVGTVIVTG